MFAQKLSYLQPCSCEFSIKAHKQLLEPMGLGVISIVQKDARIK